jgi:hypothetical protein
MLMEADRHNGHYDYMLTDKALDYQKSCRVNTVSLEGKWIIMEPDMKFYNKINEFFLSALHKQ